jgi:hypothetical protein
MLASAGGAAGGAVLGGLLVETNALTEDEAGMLLAGVGGATAYFGDGYARIAGNSVAATGAGQLAASFMQKRAKRRYERDIAKKEAEKVAAEKALREAATALEQARAQPALPPAPASGRPSNASSGGAYGDGYLTDLFRSAADELEMVDGDDERNADFDVFHVEDFE